MYRGHSASRLTATVPCPHQHADQRYVQNREMMGKATRSASFTAEHLKPAATLGVGTELVQVAYRAILTWG